MNAIPKLVAGAMAEGKNYSYASWRAGWLFEFYWKIMFYTEDVPFGASDAQVPKSFNECACTGADGKRIYSDPDTNRDKSCYF